MVVEGLYLHTEGTFFGFLRAVVQNHTSLEEVIMQFRQKPAQVALGGMFVIFGLMSMASISLAQVDTWIAKTRMPTARTLSGGCVIDGRIYVVGGAVNETNLTSAVEMYDPTNDTWTKKDTLPIGLCIHASCAFDGKMYVFGGVSPLVSSAAKKSVYVYDPKTGTWTQKADMPYINAWCGIAVVDSTIYLIGGCTVAAGSPSQTVMAYNPYTQLWTSKANMPTARFGLSASVVNGKIYAIGGSNANYQPIYNNVEVYDPSTNTWTSKSVMPTPRFGLGTCVVDGRIYAVGGCSALGASTANEVYDPATNTWTTKSSMRQPRLGLFVGLVGGKIYAVGGSNPYPQPTMYGTVEEYDTGITIVQAPQAPTLIAPPDSAINVQLSTTTTWNAATGATSYHLQVSTSSSFATTIVNDSSLTATSRAIGPLSLAAMYYWRVRAKNDGGYSSFSVTRQFSTIRTTSVEFVKSEVPKDYALSQNYPNPFNPSTRITFALPKASHVILTVIDALGRMQAVLTNKEELAGTYEVEWNASNVPSGIYFYRLQAGEFMETGKMILLR